eukprot:COSAG02_NODE_1482_length_12387_cov_6.381348_3_plen_81_part_00
MALWFLSASLFNNRITIGINRRLIDLLHGPAGGIEEALSTTPRARATSHGDGTQTVAVVCVVSGGAAVAAEAPAGAEAED